MSHDDPNSTATLETARETRPPALPGWAAELLGCPACGGRLESAGEGWRCTRAGCGAEYPEVQGVPILICEARSVFRIADFVQWQPTFFRPVGPVRRWLSGVLPELSHNLGARRVVATMRQRLFEGSERPKVLVIGGGVLGAGLEAVVNDGRVRLLETDVDLKPRVGLICDGHDLPFADGSFDAVVVQAVLEHVLDPARCVEEIHRVLRPGGLVYADTPFIAQVHARQFDFTRFTRLGHRRLFRRFTELESGISGGPGMALAWTLRYFFLSFFSGGTSRALVSALSRVAFFWLRYFDYLLVHRPAACDAASAFHFLGEKRGEVLSDEDLLKTYRGGF